MLANPFQTESITVSVTKALIRQLGVKVSSSAIKTQIDNHPDSSSILSISDSLKQWKINNYVIQVDKTKLEELPVPFIAHLKKQGGSFITVTNSTDTAVYYTDGFKREAYKPIAEFIEEWSGVTLLAEEGEDSGEKYYRQSRKRELLQALKLPLIMSIVFAFCGAALVYHYANSFVFPAFASLLMLKVAGVIFSSLLLWYEIDKANPVLKQICGMGKQTNCAAILNSKQSKLFNTISWSEVGFFYFAGGFISLLVGGTNAPAIITILSWLNVVALPYTFFSIYYQWKIAKQWCPMCLSVQAVLVAEFIVVLSTKQLNQPVSLVLPIFPSFFLPALSWFLIKPLLLQNQEAKRKKQDLLKFKYNNRIFDTLLLKQKQITADATGLGIIIGNPDATNTIIKVCNPYCRPCAKAHPELDRLLENNDDLKVQILFTATTDDGDIAALPVKHLLAIAERQNEVLTKQALDDWYFGDQKDYEAFAAKYKINDELKIQEPKVEAMDKWCKQMEITFTPTFFINSYQLPNVYSIGDLKYFLYPLQHGVGTG